jgi:hypothetical protein
VSAMTICFSLCEKNLRWRDIRAKYRSHEFVSF